MTKLLKRTGKTPVLVIFAPTACGKTQLALDLFGSNSNCELAGKAEIISADSMQVYTGMNIGTAKVEKEVLEQLPHHLLDIRHPSEPFSAGDFVRLTEELCIDIYSRGKLPVILGGTGFYIRNFMCGLPPTPEADLQLRQQLQNRLETEGGDVLFKELQDLDYQSSLRIHPNDYYRLVRALEVCISSGKPLSSFTQETSVRKDYDFCTIILERDRQELYERINNRVKEMIKQGLKEEFDALVASGCTQDMSGMQAIGYREFFSTEVQSATSLQEKLIIAEELIAKNSRHYAKRQYTFVRGIPGAVIFHAEEENLIKKHIISFLNG